METVLGLLGMMLFIACTILIAAAVTWIVVKITPTGRDKAEPTAR